MQHKLKHDLSITINEQAANEEGPHNYVYCISIFKTVTGL